MTDVGVKLLDFGLAKAGAPAATAVRRLPPFDPAGDDAGRDHPRDVPVHGAGAARGQGGGRADRHLRVRRVLYEMLTGNRPSGRRGERHRSILKEEPPSLGEVLALAPPALVHLVRLCLTKDPDNPFQTMRDVWLELHWIVESSPAAAAVAAPSSAGISWAVGALLLAAAAAAGGWWLRPASEGRRAVTRLEYPLPSDQNFSQGGRRVIAISPDGTRLAYIANRQLYVRRLDQLGAQLLITSDEFPIEPVFSPDGRWIAYFSSPPGIDKSDIRKVPVTGGAPVPLATVAGFAIRRHLARRPDRVRP